jgi:3-oxoadipate enol-lactonase
LHRHKKKINEMTISYIDEGSGDNVIVLIHGFCGSAAYFEGIIPELSEKYRVIAPSLRGHGKSSAVSEPFTMEDMADDINELLNELEINKVVMFGHSLGGYVTLAFAEQFAEKLIGFSLIHSTALPDSEEAKQNRNKSVELICEYGIEPLIEGLVPKLFAPTYAKTKVDEVELAREIGMNTSVIGAKGALKAMRDRPDRNRILRESKVPVLLIAGEDDQIIPIEKVFSEEAPFIERAIMRGTGHMGMVENPEVLKVFIQKFVEKIKI